MDEQQKAPFLSHLADLRNLFIRSFAVVLIFLVPCYFFRAEILELMLRPIISALPQGSPVVFTKPSEGFVSLLKASLFGSVTLAVPFILHGIWKFVSPALYRDEKKGLLLFIVSGSILFFTGLIFCYGVAAPQALKFLLAQNSPEFLTPLPSVSSSLSFLISMCLGFGLVFEFPLAALLLSRWGIISGEMLRNNRKYSYVAGMLAAAVITPTQDGASMMLLAVPIIIFYEAGIVTAALFGRKKKQA